MITTPRRLVLLSLGLALAAGVSGCGATGEAAGPSEMVGSIPRPADASPGDAPAESGAAPDRIGVEQRYLDELAASGLPTGMSAETIVEVGIGVCRGEADGADTETILDRLRPLTGAIAAQEPELDTTEVGRAIVEASRTHLCG